MPYYPPNDIICAVAANEANSTAQRDRKRSCQDKTSYTLSAARAALLSTLPRLSRPLSDQGKWATGMMKKELLGSAIPARALYLRMES